VLSEQAVAFLECRVESKLDAGDHWVLLANVLSGELLRENAVTAIHFRKTGASY
jgi:flavin reductase (DIM6/NTAB) family NADH-FMN oxidoreductase RutF